ncbi:MAG: lysophospholipid acyltransferase family protein [Chthoniobacterales bacterium]
MKIRLPEKRVAGFIASFIRLLALTIRVKIEDPNGFLAGPPSGPAICIVWHNRILGLVIAGFPRTGLVPMTVLTSPSRDGELLAQVMHQFGLQSVRGSSKKRGAAALLELREHFRAGRTLIITPDGPRGPIYTLSPGVLLLAQKTGAPILKTHVAFSNSRRLKSWDRFHIPLPFSKVTIRIEPGEVFLPTHSSEEFELQRVRLENQLKTGEL